MKLIIHTERGTFFRYYDDHAYDEVLKELGKVSQENANFFLHTTDPVACLCLTAQVLRNSVIEIEKDAK